jgi:hypothetical protein
MTRWLTTLTVLSIAMLSIGCVRTTHTLSEVGEKVADDEIVGVWESEEDPIFKDTHRVAIQQHRDGLYLYRDLDRADEDLVPFRLIKVADVTYLEVDELEWVALNEKVPGEAEKGESAGQALNLFPVRWERRGEWIAIWHADRTVIDRLLKGGKLTGRPADGWLDFASITSTAAELAACLEENSDEIYAISEPKPHERIVYRKVFAQAPAVAAEPINTP